MLGIRTEIWIQLFITVILLSVTTIRFFWETIKGKAFKTFYPERAIKCVIHYPNSMVKYVWRLLPDNNLLKIGKGKYIYSDTESQKLKDKFVLTDKTNKEEQKVLIDGVEYNFKTLCLCKKRFDDVPEIHYIYNNPLPIDFNSYIKRKKDGTTELDFTSSQLEQIKNNDLFAKLLALDFEENMFKLLLVMGIINLCLTGVVIAIQFGLIDIPVK